MITLYRATSGTKPKNGRGSYWAEVFACAEAYLDNPGFGGDTIFSVTVEPEYVLDLTRGNPFRLLAQALDQDTENEGVVWWHAHPDWTDAGRYVHNVWEERKRAFDAIADLYDWVRFVDDYPAGCITWMYAGSRPLPAVRMQPR